MRANATLRTVCGPRVRPPFDRLRANGKGPVLRRAAPASPIGFPGSLLKMRTTPLTKYRESPEEGRRVLALGMSPKGT